MHAANTLHARRAFLQLLIAESRNQSRPRTASPSTLPGASPPKTSRPIELRQLSSEDALIVGSKKLSKVAPPPPSRRTRRGVSLYISRSRPYPPPLLGGDARQTTHLLLLLVLLFSRGKVICIHTSTASSSPFFRVRETVFLERRERGSCRSSPAEPSRCRRGPAAATTRAEKREREKSLSLRIPPVTQRADPPSSSSCSHT